MSAEIPGFRIYQNAFTAYLRDPEANPVPHGVGARHMRIYRKMVYSGTEAFLLPCFPVLRAVLGVRRWGRLVRAFLSVHRSHTPFFRQIPGEFVQFLQTGWASSAGYPEFVRELAHYEWIELALSVSAVEPCLDRINSDGDLLADRPVVNPVLANLHFHWPVHHIRPRIRIKPAETCLLVFRDARYEIRFVGINAFTARLLDLLESGELSGRAALETVISETGHPSPEVVLEGGLRAMQDLQKSGALLGTWKEGEQ